MRAIITTFDAQAVTLSLAAAGPIEEAQRDRLHELFRSSAVVEVHVSPADQGSVARVTLGAAGRASES
jgi:hypothetical protein